MITIFPAAPGTTLLTYDFNARVTRTPIIGWQHIQGQIAFPVTVINTGGMTHGNAVYHPDGMVSDPIHRLAFQDVSEWAAFMKTAKAPKGNTTPSSPVEEPEEEEAVTFHKDTSPPSSYHAGANEAPKAGVTAAPKTRIPDKPKGKPQVFKSKSFWKLVHEPHVFVVEGGVEAPAKNDPDFEKITREEMLELKRKSHTELEWPLPEDDGMDLV